MNMGKSCVRIRKIDDVPLEVIGEAVKRVPAKKFIVYNESTVKSSGKRTRKATTKKSGSTGAAKKRRGDIAGKRAR